MYEVRKIGMKNGRAIVALELALRDVIGSLQIKMKKRLAHMRSNGYRD